MNIKRLWVCVWLWRLFFSLSLWLFSLWVMHGVTTWPISSFRSMSHQPLFLSHSTIPQLSALVLNRTEERKKERRRRRRNTEYLSLWISRKRVPSRPFLCHSTRLVNHPTKISYPSSGPSLAPNGRCGIAEREKKEDLSSFLSSSFIAIVTKLLWHGKRSTPR